jgi:23S rRNA G2445 N2-methylase RlmL
MRFFVTAAKGTEPALRDELREIGLARVRADRGGVHFEGALIDGARACLWTRVGVRVLLEVATFDAPDEGALYAGARAVDWTEWMTARTTVAVRASCRSSRLSHSQFIAQKTKDAIVDALRDRVGARPSVDKENPDVLVATHLARDRATLYLDVGGTSLHERGWRSRAGAAPLRETLAAAVVRLSDWDRRAPLIDPMCGAGTIAIEAALWANRIAPGLGRSRFGLERWASHDDGLRRQLQLLRDEARATQAAIGEAGDAPRIFAYDRDPRSVALARDNARAAGVTLVILRQEVRDLSPRGGSGFVVTNPPYGARLEVDQDVYTDLARAVHRMHGHGVALLAGSPALARAIGRNPDRFWILYNGPIECRLLVYAVR